MSVPGLMYCYGGALVGAGLLGLDKGVPVAGPAPLVPLSVGLGASMLLFGYLSTPPNGQQQPPKKGEPGFGLYMAAVHLGLLMPLAFTGVFAYRAYTARAFTHNAGSLAGLALGSVVTFLWLVALKPKKKVD